jgi:hypothetical protein
MAADNTAPKQRGTPYKPGQSGNPAGRPPGSRNKATLAIEAMLEGEAEAIGRKAIELAKSGDLTAIRLCLDRLCPPRKDRHVNFELPPMQKPADAVAATAAIVDAVARGDLTPSEAGELSRVVAAYATTLEAADFDARLQAGGGEEMNRSLDTRLQRLEGNRPAGRTRCIWVQGMSDAAINAEIAQRKAAGTLGEFDRPLLVSWMSPNEGAAA